ncbi:MAG: cofactor-independent phosphoglycerate mutase [Candidatus Omnitrophica bacterium]|nr:cofactor-independent phosphoglycerate mutase [Candidatus Omnitrophota bacterium]MBU2043748.1 cofactor-independent phosphoglycerate mutase [Candidatus Omnitrophota bacterium]MBU2251335.1 cofactor-independent phosphoglycerate mutase [Candidatus Omnitrophota bacterium]MBU2473697.1 cofactor-independent phosphoglycerate mutase [Candidatus Omnitrophota bacterium]
MKYVMIVPDGAADYPLETLGGKTPLEVADIPYMDLLAKEGLLGRVKTVPRGFIPSSDVANLSLLGYDPNRYYSGRGPLEAANLGITLGKDDLAFRCNLITEGEGKLFDYSAGHISNKEAKLLIAEINKKLGTDKIEFFFGTSYRSLMVVRGVQDLNLDKLTYHAPHDIIGKNIAKYLPRGKNSELIVDLIKRSKDILQNHEINKVRIDLGESPANMIWLWGCGGAPTMPTFKELFGISGAVISAVDLIKGIGKIIGLRVVDVEGANGYYDTNYLGKARAALSALAAHDFVFVHIEATDEAGHNQDLRMKIACLERIDKMVVGTIYEELKGQDFRILISPDHPTPLAKRTHTDEPVPFLVSGSGIEADSFSFYSEVEAQNSSLYFDSGESLMKFFLKK